MNRRILIIVSCALVLSVCASYLVYRAIGAKGSAPRPAKTTPVVVAARDLSAGSLIRDIDLKTVPWTGPLPNGAVAKTDGLVDRGVASAIYGGEPIIEARLTQKGSGGGLAGTIPAGMRACAVKVNEVVGVAGFVVPGARVDVLITGLPPGGDPAEGSRVRTLLQDIEVLSAGTDFQRDQAGKPQQAQVVNLLVTPAQAEILSLAGNEMHIQLVLRNPMDSAITTTPGTMVSALLGGARGPDSALPAQSSSSVRHAASTEIQDRPVVNPAAAPVAQPYVVDVTNGSVHTRSSFSSTEIGQ